MKKRSYLVYVKNNQVLLVRETNQTEYKLPGGRLEEGETIRATLVREIKEEINSIVDERSIKLIANYVYKSQSSAEEWETYLFTAKIDGDIKADGKEIEQTIWYGKESDYELKPYIKTHVMPILINGGFLK